MENICNGGEKNHSRGHEGDLDIKKIFKLPRSLKGHHHCQSFVEGL